MTDASRPITSSEEDEGGPLARHPFDIAGGASDDGQQWVTPCLRGQLRSGNFVAKVLLERLAEKRNIQRDRITSPFLRFGVLYATLYGAFGALSPFLPRFLGERGLPAQEIGTLAVGTMVRLVSGPIAGRFADRWGAWRSILAPAPLRLLSPQCCTVRRQSGILFVNVGQPPPCAIGAAQRRHGSYGVATTGGFSTDGYAAPDRRHLSPAALALEWLEALSVSLRSSG